MSSSPSHLDDTLNKDAGNEASEVANQLEKILASKRFKQSPRCAAFLKFVVEQKLAGRSDFIKERTIAISVFDRRPEDHSDDDSIVRIQAGRVRKRLAQYYEHEGAGDSVRISIGKGSYVPVFDFSDTTEVGAHQAFGIESPMARNRLPRIGVLPLKNLEGSSEYDYFVHGLGEELTAELERLKGLAVLAYFTTSQLRGDSIDLRKAAADLKADYFVGGSIARIDDRIRINIECLDTRTGDQIWGERFNRSLTAAALFDIQDEVVQKVVASVGDAFGSVSQSIFRRSRNKQVSELSAYEAVLAGHYFEHRLDEESLLRARPALEQAVEIEPSYAEAWALLSGVYCHIHALHSSNLEGALSLAEQCAGRAIALDKNCQLAHLSTAYVCGLKKDHPRLIAASQRAMQLNPNAAYVVGTAAFWFGIVGQFDRAFPLFEKSKELNPYFPGWFHLLPWQYALSEQDFEGALEAAYQFNMPTFFWDPLVRGAALGKLGRKEEAATAVQELLTLQPNFATQPEFYVGCFVHSDQIRADVLDGLRVGGLC